MSSCGGAFLAGDTRNVGTLLSNGMKTLGCYAMLCYANLGWESAGRSICFTQYKEGTFTMEMLTYIPMQWIVVVPLN